MKHSLIGPGIMARMQVTQIKITHSFKSLGYDIWELPKSVPQILVEHDLAGDQRIQPKSP